MSTESSATAGHLPTIGAIASRFGVPIHRVEYLVRSRGLKPAARAGVARVFSEEDVGFIAAELAKADAARPAANEGGVRHA